MRFASAVIAQIAEEYELAVLGCRKRQRGLRRLMLVQVFRGVEIDLPVRFGPIVARILFDVALHERLRGFPRCDGEGTVETVGVAFLLVVEHDVQQEDSTVALDVVEHVERAFELGEMRIDIFDELRCDLFAKLLEHGTFFVEGFERPGDDRRWPV